MPKWQSYLMERRGRFLEEFLDFLCIPSVSALPEHRADIRRAARWVAERLRVAGLERVQVLETGGHPAVYGEWQHQPDRPTILIYGHFDVQPAGPAHLWTSPPFGPEVRDGRIYARGASNNKGNTLMAILAVEALLKGEGRLPVNVKFLIEGEEEIGSPQLPAFLAANRQLLQCDLVLNTDGANWDEDQPSLPVAAKGVVSLEIEVEGANIDLYSDLYAGTVQNPLQALARILDSLLGLDGELRVEGILDDVAPLTDEDRALIARVPFNEAAYQAHLGVNALCGEPGYSPLERAWARPTLEVNGIWGGYQDDWVKALLPRNGLAKITCRLVPNQDPDRVAESLAAHVQRQAPPGVRVTVRQLQAKARPYLIPTDHPALQIAYGVLTEVFGRTPFHTRTSGTHPVLELFLRQLGAYTVTVGFGTEDERIHVPDEFLRLKNFERGPVGYARLLEQLAAAQV